MPRCIAFILFFCTVIRSFAFPEIINPSFEADVFGKFPGYANENGSVITGWNVATGGPQFGVWHQDDGAWANNGKMSPEQEFQYFFFQITVNATGTVAQTVYKFAPGRKYKLLFDYNVRDWPEVAQPELLVVNTLKYPYASPKASIWISLGGQEIFRNTNAFAVEPAMFHTVPWHRGESVEFTATQTEYELKIEAILIPGTYYADASPTFDNFRFVQINPDVNTPPIIEEILDQVATPGVPLVVPISASDTNEPTQNLTYSIVSGPTNSTLENNIFYWTPETFDAGPIPVTIRVTDDGEGKLFAERSFNITMDVLRIDRIQVGTSEVLLTWRATTGRSYQIYHRNLLTSEESWSLAAGIVQADSDPMTYPVPMPEGKTKMFYRLELLP